LGEWIKGDTKRRTTSTKMSINHAAICSKGEDIFFFNVQKQKTIFLSYFIDSKVARVFLHIAPPPPPPQPKKRSTYIQVFKSHCGCYSSPKKKKGLIVVVEGRFKWFAGKI
jgi:hypothetical protein